LDSALKRIDQFDWLVFSSTNGVDAVVRRIMRTLRDLRILGNVKIAAIGPGTHAALRAYHLRADMVPDEFRAEALAETLAKEAKGKRFLLARASRGREVLAESLTAAGGIVEQVVVYQSVDVECPDPEIAARLKAGRIDWITVTSSAIARSLARMFGADLKRARLASISPVTSGTLRELGYEPAAEATQYTMEGVAAAILRAVQSASPPT
jgi:uroporphyrinogen III methyltransferase/synthase